MGTHPVSDALARGHIASLFRSCVSTPRRKWSIRTSPDSWIELLRTGRPVLSELVNLTCELSTGDVAPSVRSRSRVPHSVAEQDSIFSTNSTERMPPMRPAQPLDAAPFCAITPDADSNDGGTNSLTLGP
jgi:hypothetical protein